MIKDYFFISFNLVRFVVISALILITWYIYSFIIDAAICEPFVSLFMRFLNISGFGFTSLKISFIGNTIC